MNTATDASGTVTAPSQPIRSPGRPLPFQPVQAAKPQQSIWDEFKAAFTGPGSIGDAAGHVWDAVKPVLGAVNAQMGAPMSTGIVGANQGMRTGAFTQDQANAYVANAAKAAPGGIVGSTGMLIAPAMTGMVIADKAWSYGVARPASTVALLTDPGSPVWKKGMSLDAIEEAWNKSETVSFGRAAMASPLTKYFPTMMPLVAAGLTNYDPWSEGDMAAAGDNPIYNFVTGVTDASLMFVVPPAAKAARLAMQAKMGLRTTITSAADLNAMRTAFDEHAAGTKVTPYGQEVDIISHETNPSVIRNSPTVAQSTGVDKAELSDILSRTNDPKMVNEILLATRGDVRAIHTLIDNAPKHIWSLADMNSVITDAAVNGIPYRPAGEALTRLNQTFDSVASAEDFYAAVKHAVVDEKSGMPYMGSTWMPTDSLVVEQMRRGIAHIKTVVQTGEGEIMPRWVPVQIRERVSGPARVFMQWTGSKQPLGVVSNSGMRPNDWRDEFQAMVNSIPSARGGRDLPIGVEMGQDGIVNVNVTSPEFRAYWTKRLVDAGRGGGLKDTWHAMEDQLVEAMSRELNVNVAEARKIVEGYRAKADEAVAYLNESGGYIFDEKGAQHVLDPQSARQFLDSFQTLPMEEIYQQLRVFGSTPRKFIEGAGEFGTSAFDFGMKIFRTNLLFRPGYTPKNSVIEPMISAFLAHGTIATDEGVLAALSNFVRNRGNNLLHIIYRRDLDKVVKGVVARAPYETRTALKSQLDELIARRYDAQAILDSLNAELGAMQTGGVSPTAVKMYMEEVKSRMAEAQSVIDRAESALDGQLPEWRQVVPPAQMTDVKEALREYNAILGHDTQYPQQLRSVISSLDRSVRRRVTTPLQAAQLDLQRAETRLHAIDAHLKVLSEDTLPEQSVATHGRQIGRTPRVVTKQGIPPEGSPASARAPIPDKHLGMIRGYVDNVPGEVGDLARGRDYQGIAWQRQRTEAVKAVEDAQAAVDAAPQHGPEFSAFALTPNERAELRAAEAALARIEAGPAEGLQAHVDELQRLYDETNAIIHGGLEHPNVKIDNANRLIQKIDNQIGAVQRRYGLARDRLSRVSGARAYHGSGDGYMTLYVGGEPIKTTAAFSTRGFDQGVGVRAEASSEATNRMTYDPSYRASHEVAKWRRTGETVNIGPNDPTYWDEHAFVTNSFFRGERLNQKILEGWSKQRILEWGNTPEGKAYQREMGMDFNSVNETTAPIISHNNPIDLPTTQAKPTYDSDITNAAGTPRDTGPKLEQSTKSPLDKQPKEKRARRVIVSTTTQLDERIRLIHQYIPDPKMRALAAEREVTPGEMQAAMGHLPPSQTPGDGGLSRILGEDVIYNPQNKGTQAAETLNNALDKIWQLVATLPETRLFRWPFYQRQFHMEMEQRANTLASQGVTHMTSAEFDGFRQAAHRSALLELEKTFYNIRRYSTPVYSSRFLMSFPGAFFNSIYRYGRFAAKEPERLFQAALLASDIVQNGGVDDRGNHVQNLADAKWILIPHTTRHDAEGNPTDYGVRFSVQSGLSVTVNYPAPSYLTSVLAAVFVQANPTNEDKLKSILGEDGYTALFPFGVTANAVSNMFSTYQKLLHSAVAGTSDVDFMDAAVKIYADNMANWEKEGSNGPAPTIDDAIGQTRGWMLTEAAVKWAEAFSSDKNVPGQMARDSWRETQQMFPGRPDEARAYFVKMHGESARWYTYASSVYSAYVPVTEKAYNRVFQDFPSLTERIVKWAGKDAPEYAALLAIGTDGTFSQSVYNYYKRNALPGDDTPVIAKMDPGTFENNALVDEGWQEYSVNKAIHDAEQARYKKLRDDATNEQSKAVYRIALDAENKAWDGFINGPGGLAENNQAWAFAKGGGKDQRGDRAAQVFDMILSDPKFAASDAAKEPLWGTVKDFLVERKNTLDAIAKVPMGGYHNNVNGKVALSQDDARKAIREGFVQYVTDNIIPDEPQFGSIWDRYFSQEWGVQ